MRAELRSIALACAVACRGGHPAVMIDAPAHAADADHAAHDTAAVVDAAVSCEVFGAPGTCVAATACSALANQSAYPGACPGSAGIQCCIETPNVANNPPPPTGYQLMAQADVTPAMTTWAVQILDAPVTYPMFSTTTMLFGTLDVLARVEWHPPDFQNDTVHRGVTLYQPSP